MKNINFQSEVPERFIPIELDDLVTDFTDSGLLTADQCHLFEKFASAFEDLYHATSYRKLKTLIRSYQHFNPDRDTVQSNKLPPDESLNRFKKQLSDVLNNANFDRLSTTELNAALNKTSPYGVQVSVDFDEFEEVFLFFRGSATRSEMHWKWNNFLLKKRPVRIEIYRRLFVVLQPKSRRQWIEYLVNQKGMSPRKAVKKAAATLKNLGITGDRQVLYLKVFKDIPRADLEMLFPNTRIRIRLFDKLKLGIMGGGGTAGGVMATVSKFSSAIDPLSAVIAIAGLIGVLWRQVAKIFSQRAKYSAILTKSLYFYNLANNLSTLTYLADIAEAEECKEALLAYFFLLTAGTSSRDELDKTIEDFIGNRYSIPMDFEISDGLNKLQKTGLLVDENGLYRVLPLDDALSAITEQWQNLSSRLSGHETRI